MRFRTRYKLRCYIMGIVPDWSAEAEYVRGLFTAQDNLEYSIVACKKPLTFQARDRVKNVIRYSGSGLCQPPANMIKSARY